MAANALITPSVTRRGLLVAAAVVSVSTAPPPASAWADFREAHRFISGIDRVSRTAEERGFSPQDVARIEFDNRRLAVLIIGENPRSRIYITPDAVFQAWSYN